MALNNRINILLIVFSILYILSSCSIIDRGSVVFPLSFSTILNSISFLSALMIVCFYKFGVKVIKETKSSYLLFLCFYLACLFFSISYCYVMVS